MAFNMINDKKLTLSESEDYFFVSQEFPESLELFFLLPNLGLLCSFFLWQVLHFELI